MLNQKPSVPLYSEVLSTIWPLTCETRSSSCLLTAVAFSYSSWKSVHILLALSKSSEFLSYWYIVKRYLLAFCAIDDCCLLILANIHGSDVIAKFILSLLEVGIVINEVNASVIILWNGIVFFLLILLEILVKSLFQSSQELLKSLEYFQIPTVLS